MSTLNSPFLAPRRIGSAGDLVAGSVFAAPLLFGEDGILDGILRAIVNRQFFCQTRATGYTFTSTGLDTRTYLSEPGIVKGAEFERRVRKLAKHRNVSCEFVGSKGKGRHGRPRFGRICRSPARRDRWERRS